MSSSQVGARARRLSLNSSEPAPRSIAVVSVVAPLWAALLGLIVVGIPVVLGWVTSMTTTTTWGDVLHIIGVGWVVAHAVPFSVGTTTYSLLPLGLLVIPGVLLYHSGRWVARSARIATRSNALIAIALASLVYGIAVAVIAALSSFGEVAVLPARAGLTAFVVSALALGAGVLRDSGVGAQTLAAAGEVVRRGVGAFVVMLAGLVALAVLLVVVAMVFSFGDVLAITNVLAPGIVGGLVLFVLQLAYLPVLGVWAIAFAAGPGFAIGPNVVLSPYAQVAAVTQLPPVPVLAALPETSSPVLWFAPVLVLIVGSVAGVYLTTRLAQWKDRVVAVIGAGLGVMVVTAIAAAAANGALGDVRLARLGPNPFTTAIAVGVLVILGGLAGSIRRRGSQ